MTIEGQSFRNEALTGSGTIEPDGTYSDPKPDPTEERGLGPDRTSGGRLITGGGLGNADSVSTSETTQADASKAAPAKRAGSSNR